MGKSLLFRLQVVSALILAGMLALLSGWTPLKEICHAQSAGPDFLTREERAWLAAHPVISLAPERNYAPFIFVDSDGALKGISVDYLSLLEKKLGIRFQMMKPDNLNVILDRVRRGEADLVTSLMKTPERSESLLFTAPYISVPAVIIVRKSFERKLPINIERMDGLKIALGKGYAVQPYLQKKYPQLSLVPVDNDVTGLTRVSFGDLDAAVLDLASASHIIESLKITNLRLGGEVDFNYALSMASRRDWPLLDQILEKGIARVTPNEKEEVLNKWVRLSRPSPFEARTVWVVLASLTGVILAGAAVAFLWNQSLKGKIQQKTEELRTELAERQKAETALMESEELYRLTLNSISDAVFITDDQGAFTFICPNVDVIFGSSIEEVQALGSISALLGGDPVEPRLLPLGSELANIEKEITDKSGRRHTLLITVKGVAIRGGTRLYTCRDITERKDVEEALRASEKKFAMAFRTAPYAMTITRTTDGKLLEVNEAFYTVSGFSREEVSNSSSVALNLWADGEDRNRVVAELRKGQKVYQKEFRFRRKNGELMTGLFSAEMIIINEEHCVLSSINDITEYRQAMDALREREEKYRAIFDESVTTIFLFDTQKNFVDANKAGLDLLGYSREELLQMSIPDVDADPVAVQPAHRELLAGGRIINYEHNLRRKDGTVVTVLNNSRALSDSGGKVVGMLSTLMDITERRRIEEQLREREEIFSTIFEQAKDAIVLVDAQGRVIEFNTAAHDGLGYTREAFAGMSIPADIQAEHTSEVIQENREKTLKQGDVTFETKHRHRNGEIRDVLVSLRPLKIKGIEYFASVWTDITERKQAETALRASLEEKIALLKEVHHRVKNNLQIVASLLSLQSGRSDNAQVVNVLQDTRNRVRSMALLHETLYRSGNLAQVNFATYLHDLCGQLLVSFSTQAQRIRMEYRVAEIGLPLEQAVPCGLIVSELVSNALKHGFTDRRGGRIVVGLEQAAGDDLVLTVRDDGRGLPPDFNPAATATLGLQLVSGLVGQLGGQLEIEKQGPGAAFRILFSVPKDIRVGGA
jgi:PAS domain S-box-containing protein